MSPSEVPPLLHKKPWPKIIFFTDFDGTVTLQDTNDLITDTYGMGFPERRKLMEDILGGKTTFRDAFQLMLDSWHMPFPQVLSILKSAIEPDPHFKDFVAWAKANGVPVIVLSSGLVPVIEELLRSFLEGDEQLLAGIHDVIANGTQLRGPEGSLDRADGWTIKFHDPDSGYGHDKSRTIRPYAEAIAQLVRADAGLEKPTLLYAGDGVSDLSAARETDLLFAKEGRDLVAYCEKEGIPFTEFDDWRDILRETKDIFDGRKTVHGIAEEGLQRHRTNSLVLERKPSLHESAATQPKRTVK